MIKERINVLYVTHDTNLYGSNQSLLYLIKELRVKHNVDPIVLAPGRGELIQKLEKENIKYIVVKYCLWQAVYKTGFRFIVKAVLRRTQNLLAWIKVKKAIKGIAIDLVHSNSSVIEIGAKCAMWLNKPHVWHIREFGQEDWGMKYIYSPQYVQKRYSTANILVTVSKGIEAKFRKEYPDCKVRTIYNGIPLEKFTPQMRCKKDEVNFCHVGYISAAKNQIQVLEACKILRDKYNLKFKMNFIGSGDGDYYEKFLNYIAQNNLSPYVKLWGFQEHIEEVLPLMDVGIMSSKMEGFGRVTVEFMLAGMPVIGFAAGGTKELIENEVTGFLYYTLDDLVKYMLLLHQNAEMVSQMGESAYLHAKSNFTAEKNADSIYKVYENILSVPR